MNQESTNAGAEVTDLEEPLFIGNIYVYRGPYPRSEGRRLKAKVEEAPERETAATFASRSAAGRKAAATRERKGIPHFTRKIEI